MVIMTATTCTAPRPRLIKNQNNRGNEIRTRLLNRLGIQRKETNLLLQASEISHVSKRRKSAAIVETPQQAEEEYTVPLQHTIVEECYSTTRPSPPLLFEKKSKVHFQEQVHVKTIPSHRDYDQATLQQMYSSIREIQTEAERNDYEFTLDGGTLEQCKEEDEFLLWKDELVHPATFERLEQEEIAKIDMEAEEEDSICCSEASSINDLPMLQRGEVIVVGTMEPHEVSSNTRKRKNEEEQPFSDFSNNTLRRSPKVSSFADYSDHSGSDSDMTYLMIAEEQ